MFGYAGARRELLIGLPEGRSKYGRTGQIMDLIAGADSTAIEFSWPEQRCVPVTFLVSQFKCTFSNYTNASHSSRIPISLNPYVWPPLSPRSSCTTRNVHTEQRGGDVCEQNPKERNAVLYVPYVMNGDNDSLTAA